MSPDRAEILAELRRRLAPTAPPVLDAEAWPSGVPALDALTGGWPRPGLTAIVGAPGTGRLGFVLPTLAALTARERWVAVIDPNSWLYPPGLPDVNLARMLLIRPPAPLAAWAAEQCARSGAVDLVLLLDPPPLHRAGRRLFHAAEAGRTAILVIQERIDPDLPARLRLEMSGRGVARLTRGHPDARVDLPTAPQPPPLPVEIRW